MKKRNITLFTAIAAAAAFASTAQAAISYVGNQDNVEAEGNTNWSGWRNATSAKTFDIDGDNIMGSDGYQMFENATSGITSLPGYIASVTKLASHSGVSSSGFGIMDDPADPTGNDTINFGLWFDVSDTPGDDLFSFVIQGTDLDGQTLRIGLAYDSYNRSGSQNLRVTQTVGSGSGFDESGVLTFNDDGLDFASFDLTGLVAGDTFVINDAIGSGTDGFGHVGGITFDTIAIPEPSSMGLLALSGLVLLRRRRA
tara:strand:- start:180 stop:944 length:765 start_codon:yes stop_codon:yes gene_type:complete